MTTEIAVMNRRGIALAADSMSTVTGPGVRFQLTGHRKLSALSDTQPLAVMVYGRADHMGAMWVDSIIPRFKSDHAATIHETVESAAIRLRDFVDASAPRDDVAERNLLAFVQALFVEMALKACELEAEFGEDGLRKSLSPSPGTLKDALSLLDGEARDAAPALDRAAVRRIKAWRGGDPFRRALAIMPRNDAALHRAFARFVDHRLAAAIPTGAHSGVVVAGYGRDQDEPALVELVFEGLLGPVPKTFTGAVRDMAKQALGCVEVFGIRDGIDAFMLGMDDDLGSRIASLQIRETTRALSVLAKATRSSVSNKDLARIAAASSLAFTEGIEIAQMAGRSAKVAMKVTASDLHGLADLARSLVAGSIARHDYSPDAPGVGGGVDVATMSRHSDAIEFTLHPRERGEARVA